MFKQSHWLMRQLDAVLAGGEKYISIGSQHAAQEELLGLPAAASSLIEPYGTNAVLHCQWELHEVERAAQVALRLLDDLTGLSSDALRLRRHAFEAAVQEAERWTMRAQSEAYTAAGPTVLPLINLAFRSRAVNDEISVRCHLYSALEQCESTMEGAFNTQAERESWEELTFGLRDLLKGEKPQPLEPLLHACRAIELAMTETGQWTPWASLNRLITLAASVVFGGQEHERYFAESRRLHVELNGIERGVLTEAHRLANEERLPLVRQVEAIFAAIQRLIADLDSAVIEGMAAAVPACARRLRWTLTDLAICQAELELLPTDDQNLVACVFCQERNGPDRSTCKRCSAILPREGGADVRSNLSVLERDGAILLESGHAPIMTEKMEPVLRAIESYCAGVTPATELEATLVQLQQSLDETAALVAQKCSGPEVERFEAGVDRLYQALGQWGDMLQNGTEGAAEAGLQCFFDGVQILVDTQYHVETQMDYAIANYGLVA